MLFRSVAIIKESYDKALEMLRENRELMDKLSAFLIEKETITGKEFMEIFRREKGIPEPEEKEESGVNKTEDDVQKSVEVKAEEDKAPDEDKVPKEDKVTDSPSKEAQSGDESDEGSLGLFSGSRLK